MKFGIIAAALLLALLGGCRQQEPPHVDEVPAGREETRGIRNTEHIGYAGNAMADKVDQALDTVDDSKRRLDAAEAAQTAP